MRWSQRIASSKELGRVIEMEFLGDLPGLKSSGKGS